MAGSIKTRVLRLEDAAGQRGPRSGFAAAEDAELWLRPVPEKIRWFDPDTQREVQAARDPMGARP